MVETDGEIVEKKGLGRVVVNHPTKRVPYNPRWEAKQKSKKFDDKRLADIEREGVLRKESREKKMKEAFERSLPTIRKPKEEIKEEGAILDLPTSELTLEDIKKLRTEKPRKYAEMLRQGKLRNFKKDVLMTDHRGVEVLVPEDKVEAKKAEFDAKFALSEEQKAKDQKAREKYEKERGQRKGVLPEVNVQIKDSE